MFSAERTSLNNLITNHLKFKNVSSSSYFQTTCLLLISKQFNSHHFTMNRDSAVRWCIQKFPDWPPGWYSSLLLGEVSLFCELV